MAVTGFWPVFKNLQATLDYTDNPDKTTAPEYLDEDLYAALRYAGNDDKTDRKMFVGGINCSAQNAYAEMVAVQRRFGLRGKVVGYHGIQSFREGEVTPEQAFVIGKETARQMWGDRYQVLVTVHLNTDNVHCHFVVNPVSFKDGAKFKNKIGDHKELRRISDAICREHGLSVLENSEFYSKGKKKEYWVHRAGKQTHRDLLRQDIDQALSQCGSFQEIEYYLKCMGYRFERDFGCARPSVLMDGWQRPVRIDSLGKKYGKEAIRERCLENQRKPELYVIAYPKWKRAPLLTLEHHCGRQSGKIPSRCCLKFLSSCLNSALAAISRKRTADRSPRQCGRRRESWTNIWKNISSLAIAVLSRQRSCLLFRRI